MVEKWAFSIAMTGYFLVALFTGAYYYEFRIDRAACKSLLYTSECYMPEGDAIVAGIGWPIYWSCRGALAIVRRWK